MIEVTINTKAELFCAEAEDVHLITTDHLTFKEQLDHAVERWGWEITGKEKAIVIREKGDKALWNLLVKGDWVSFGGKTYGVI